MSDAILTMQFESWSALLHMGGHGPYVWPAFLITVLTWLWLWLVTWRRARRLAADFAATEPELKDLAGDRGDTGGQ